MLLIKPSVEILTPMHVIDGMITRIEAAGRTCYKSENKITSSSAGDFVRMVIRRGHETVIEHEVLSVRLVCDRGVTHELVRHRIASYSQESTRYCNYGKEDNIKFILPTQFLGHIETKLWSYDDVDMTDDLIPADVIWLRNMLRAEQDYNALLNLGWTPQQARSVLPNSLKTEIVVTCNLREWRHIFKLRTAKEAHPDMITLLNPLLTEFATVLPDIFGDMV